MSEKSKCHLPIISHFGSLTHMAGASSNSGKTKATTVEAPSVASSARPPPPPPSAYGAGHGGADPEIVRRSLERLVAGDLSSPNPAVVKSDADKGMFYRQ